MRYFTPPDSNDSLSRIMLDNKEYLLRFTYNYIGGFWVMGIYKNIDSPYIAGIKLVPKFPSNWFCRQYVELPQGILGLVTNLEKVGRDDFANGNARMVYWAKSEVGE